MKVRLAIRGFGDGQIVFHNRLEHDEDDLENVLPNLVEEHGQLLKRFERFMIEIEFLDEPDPLQRFFRFGTDPRGMMIPMRVDLNP